MELKLSKMMITLPNTQIMFYTFEEQKDARYLFSVMAYDVQRANSCCDMILKSMDRK